MSDTTPKQTTNQSYDEYKKSVVEYVDSILDKHKIDNNKYLATMHELKNKASEYVANINETNRNLSEIIVSASTDIESKQLILNGDLKKIDAYIDELDLSTITNHSTYIDNLAAYKFTDASITASKKLKNTDNKEKIGNVIKNTYDYFTNSIDLIQDFHDKCTKLIKAYGICSIFYDKYLQTMESKFLPFIEKLQDYRIIRANNSSSGDNSTTSMTELYDDPLFLFNIDQQKDCFVDPVSVASVDEKKKSSTKNARDLNIIMFNEYSKSYANKRKNITTKAYDLLIKIFDDNYNFIECIYSDFSKYTLDASIEYAIECNDIHNLLCSQYLYLLFDKFKKLKSEIIRIKTSVYQGKLVDMVTNVFYAIKERRKVYDFTIPKYNDIHIKIRLPYLVDYCELMTIYNVIIKKHTDSYGEIVYTFFKQLLPIDATESKENEISVEDKEFDAMFTAIVKKYILNFNMLALHVYSDDAVDSKTINDVGLSVISYNIANNNIYNTNVDVCTLTKKKLDISRRSTGKIKLSMILCYTALLFSIIFNVLMFVFKEKIRNKFNSPTSSKVINNVFYWVNLSCIVAAGLSSFLRITDVYSTSFFKRIGVIVTVNVITMIFCSFSLYFIDPNTFWNTTAKTGETKNTENNNSNTDANANDNANAKQQSSN